MLNEGNTRVSRFVVLTYVVTSLVLSIKALTKQWTISTTIANYRSTTNY